MEFRIYSENKISDHNVEKIVCEWNFRREKVYTYIYIIYINIINNFR